MIVYHGSSEIVRNPDILHSYRPNYDQIAFISQRAIDDLLVFDSYKEV